MWRIVGTSEYMSTERHNKPAPYLTDETIRLQRWPVDPGDLWAESRPSDLGGRDPNKMRVIGHRKVMHPALAALAMPVL